MSIRPIRKQTPAKPGKEKTRPQLAIVGPDYVAPEPVLRRTRRAKVKAEPVAAPQAENCPLCGGTIGRMDFEVHARTGRCGPCDEALTG